MWLKLQGRWLKKAMILLTFCNFLALIEEIDWTALIKYSVICSFHAQYTSLLQFWFYPPLQVEQTHLKSLSLFSNTTRLFFTPGFNFRRVWSFLPNLGSLKSYAAMQLEPEMLNNTKEGAFFTHISRCHCFQLFAVGICQRRICVWNSDQNSNRKNV